MSRIVLLMLAGWFAVVPAVVSAQVDSTRGGSGDSTTGAADSSRVTPEGLALADSLLHELDVEALMRAGVEAQFDVMQRQLPAFANVRDVMEAWAKEHMTIAEFAPPLDTAYAAMFTADDLRQLIAFYRTPLGRKVAKTAPALAQKGARIGAAVGQRYAPELRQMLEARITQLRDSVKSP